MLTFFAPNTDHRDIWHSRGYTTLYETTAPIGPHYDVVPIDRVLGQCPLMRLYRNVSGTIPQWAESQQVAAYPCGRRQTNARLGSSTFVINQLGLKYSR